MSVDVSVIVPTYNRREYVTQAVQSVLAQSYKDYELIIVDDGSTDRSQDSLQSYCQSDQRVKYFYRQHKGRSAARNYGLTVAEGRYITFLDSDDVYLPNKLEIQVEVLESRPDVDLVYCLHSFMDGEGKPLPDLPTPSYRFSGRIYPDIVFFKGGIVTTPSVMVRRAAIRRAGFFDENMEICEDLDLWRRVAMYSIVEQIGERLVVVRTRAESKMPLWTFLKARQVFYEKALSEDPMLTRNVRLDLYSELYFEYALASLRQGMLALFLFLLMRLVLLGPGVVRPTWDILRTKFVHGALQ